MECFCAGLLNNVLSKTVSPLLFYYLQPQKETGKKFHATIILIRFTKVKSNIHFY